MNPSATPCARAATRWSGGRGEGASCPAATRRVTPHRIPSCGAAMRYVLARQLDDALVRAEPAELLRVGHRALQRAETGHEVLDLASDEALRVEGGGLADQVVALAEGEGEAAAAAAIPPARNRR